MKAADIPFDNNSEEFVFDSALFDLNALSALDNIYKSLESVEPKSASVKFMITLQEEADLTALGYSKEHIRMLKPQEAEDILKSGTSAEPRHEQE